MFYDLQIAIRSCDKNISQICIVVNQTSRMSQMIPFDRMNDRLPSALDHALIASLAAIRHRSPCYKNLWLLIIRRARCADLTPGRDLESACASKRVPAPYPLIIRTAKTLLRDAVCVLHKSRNVLGSSVTEVQLLVVPHQCSIRHHWLSRMLYRPEVFFTFIIWCNC